MASQVPFKKNTAASVGLTLYTTAGAFIANPGTLTAKISKDFGDYADIGTTSEEDSTYGQIKLALTNTEMNADVVMLYVKDDTSGCVPWTMTIYTAADILDNVAGNVWDELRADHTTINTFGDIDTTDDIADTVWGEALPAAYGAGTAGKILGDNLNAPVATVDTVVDAIKAKTDNLPASPAAVGSAMTLANGAITAAVIATDAIDADAISDDFVDAILDEVVEGSTTMRQMLRGFASALLSKVSGAATSTATFRDIGDTKNRIVAQVDASGNRSAVTLTLT